MTRMRLAGMKANALAAAIAATLAGTASAQETPPRPDTSQWKCEQCPFAKGYEAQYEAGATYVSDDSARFGNYTGYDEEGVEAHAEGNGRFISDDYRLQWDLLDLGTDAREVEIAAGQPGTYEVELEYSELPYRRFDTTQTPFRRVGDSTLALPAGWVAGGTTAGLTSLQSSLIDRDIGSDRTNYGIGAEFSGIKGLNLRANYRRTEREGWNIVGASFYTSGALLAAPFDDRTDTIDFAATYARDRWFVELGWSGSFYDNTNRSWTFDNAFFASSQGQIAQAPDSDAQAVTLSGAYRFPADTTVSLSASIGEITQDEQLLAYSINPSLAGTLPRDSLDAKIDTTHVDFRVTSEPLEFLRLRATYRYDERDNKTPVALWSRSIVDIFPSGDAEANRPYSFERTRYGASATARFGQWLDFLKPFELEGGYDRVEMDRTLQEVSEQNEDTGWGRIRWRPGSLADISLRAGLSRRDVDENDYDLTLAAQYDQNPLMRKYNVAYRFRDFAELRTTVSLPGQPITFGLEAYYATDDYTDSPIGLRKADDRRYAADVTWTVTDNISAFLQGGYEDIESRTVNSELFGAPDWNARHNDLFRSAGAGIDLLNLADRFDVRFNVLWAEGTGNIEVQSRASGSGAFPQLETKYKSATVDVAYRLTDALDLRLRLRYDDFNSSDWALENVEPATLPAILTLGADPYDYDVYLATIAVRYSFGRAPRAATKTDDSAATP